MKVLFATKTWQGDYPKFLSGAFERKAGDYSFADKWLMLNNGVPKEAFENYKTIDVIEEQADTLDFFNLTDEDFKTDKGNGYWYSIAELTAIRLAKDFDYLCWIQGDCLVEGDWLDKGISILETDPNISVVSPISECNSWHDLGGIDQYFSDQAFLIRVPEFRQPIYSYDEPELPDYPAHGGNSFEKKCAQYLLNTGKARRILYDAHLIHPAY